MNKEAQIETLELKDETDARNFKGQTQTEEQKSFTCQ